jgi:hypothetical protein
MVVDLCKVEKCSQKDYIYYFFLPTNKKNKTEYLNEVKLCHQDAYCTLDKSPYGVKL